jgi:hypothetical protein
MKKQKLKPLIHPKVEQVLRQVILKDLSRGRQGYDRQHTEAVVYWMKELLTRLQPPNNPLSNNPTLDSQVLVTAAYAHDWGYTGLFASPADGRSLGSITEQKVLHMHRGAAMIEQLLYQRLSSHFSEQQILRVSHLVLFHDRVRFLRDKDEILLMEADTLGMIDRERVSSTFSAADHERFLEKSIYKLRLPRFKHEEAKEIALKLLLRFKTL